MVKYLHTKEETRKNVDKRDAITQVSGLKRKERNQEERRRN